MRIISFNTNGLRSAAKKGFFDWFKTTNADFLCIQETKAQESQLDDKIFKPDGYSRYFSDAQKKGYSGVVIYSKHKPQHVRTGIGLTWADNEGRYIELQFTDFTVSSLYLPSGSSKAERQLLKMDFLDEYAKTLTKDIAQQNPMVVCGDFNIVHKEIDIKNWKSNQKHSGCLPEERAWLDEIFDNIGWIDAFRIINKEKDQYTWWSNRGQARAKNVGWRIDYQITTPNLQHKIKNVKIYKEKWFSDHAPLIIDYDYNL